MRALRSPAPLATESARAALVILIFIVIHSTVSIASDSKSVPLDHQDVQTRTIELIEGVTMKYPVQGNATENMVSFEIDTKKNFITGRGAGKQTNLLQRILPLFIMPFLIQSTIVPFFLSTLKFMLFKSVMVGKIALALIIFNAFRNHNTFKSQDDVSNIHYGYHGNGMDEYGAQMLVAFPTGVLSV